MAEREKLQSFVVRMPKELHEQLKAKAKAEERTLAQVVRYALRKYIED